jgi:hypothetical protein
MGKLAHPEYVWPAFRYVLYRGSELTDDGKSSVAKMGTELIEGRDHRQNLGLAPEGGQQAE